VLLGVNASRQRSVYQALSGRYGARLKSNRRKRSRLSSFIEKSPEFIWEAIKAVVNESIEKRIVRYVVNIPIARSTFGEVVTVVANKARLLLSVYFNRLGR